MNSLSDSAPVELRELQAGDPGDVGDYRRIRLAALAGAPDAFGSVHAVEAMRPIEDFQRRLSESTVWGAYAGATIVGMIGLGRETGTKDAHKGFVWGFYVEPGWRGQKIGARLLAALIAAARQEFEQLTLAVVRENSVAIALYERFGFLTYGIEPRALKSASGYADEVLMALLFDRVRVDLHPGLG